MADEQIDANSGEDTGSTEPSVSEVPSPSLEDVFDDNFDDKGQDSDDSDVEPDEDSKPGAGDESESDGESTEPSEGAEQNTPDDLSQKPFHEHPRFQELNAKVKETKAALEAANKRLAAIDAREAAKAKAEADARYKAENPELDDDELSDMIINNPKEYEKYLGKKIAENMRAESEAKAAAAQRQTQIKTNADLDRARYEKFFTGKEDLVKPMLENGSMEKFLADNPGTDPIHAFYELSKEAVAAKTIEDARKKWEADMKAKGRFNPVSKSGGKPTTPTPNPKKGRAALYDIF